MQVRARSGREEGSHTVGRGDLHSVPHLGPQGKRKVYPKSFFRQHRKGLESAGDRLEDRDTAEGVRFVLADERRPQELAQVAKALTCCAPI